MSNFTTLIFDFDGTLGDTFESQFEILKKVAAEENINFDPDINQVDHKKISVKDLIKQYEIGPLKLSRMIKKSQQELNKIFDQIDFFPDLENTLRSLAKDYRLGILSSNSQENIEKFLRLKHIDFFDFIYTGPNLFGKDKIFKKILKKEKLAKNEILYFGDEVRDIEACQNLGIQIAAVTWGFDHQEILEKAQPNYLISKPKEIKKLLTN